MRSMMDQNWSKLYGFAKGILWLCESCLAQPNRTLVIHGCLKHTSGAGPARIWWLTCYLFGFRLRPSSACWGLQLRMFLPFLSSDPHLLVGCEGEWPSIDQPVEKGQLWWQRIFGPSPIHILLLEGPALRLLNSWKVVALRDTLW